MKIMKKFIMLGLITVLILGSMTHYAAAQENEQESESGERSVSVETSGTSVYIESANEAEGQEDALEIEIDVSGNPEFSLAYYSETTQTEVESSLRLEIYELIEFVDTNGNGVFDGDTTDDRVQTYEIGEIGFDPIDYTTSELDSGATQHKISFQTTDGIFKTVIYIVGEFANIEGTDLEPTSMKIDFIISNFNFSQTDTKLAMFSEVESSSEVETESDDDADGQIESDEEAVIQQTDGAYAFYSWKNTAEVDGQTTDVMASYEEISGSYQEIYLNYEQGQKIIHDPKLGISLSGGNNSFLNFTPTVLIFVTIAIAALIYRVRPKQR